MSSMDKEILKIVRRIRDRIHMGIILRCSICGIAVSLAISLLLVLFSRIIPIYDVYFKAVLLTSSGACAGCLFGMFKTPKDSYAALKADSFGLHERIITALELVGTEGIFAELEKKDALRFLEKFEYKKHIPVKPPKKYLILCLILTLVLALSGFVPNPMADEALRLHERKQKINEQQKKVDKIVEKIRENKKLSPEQKKEIEAKLEELKKEIKTAINDKDIEKALKKAEKKLEIMRKKYSDDSLDKVINTLSKYEATKALADTLKRKDEKALKKEIADMAEVIKNMNSSQIKELAKNMTDLARELKDNPELKQAFSDLAQQMSGGELGDITSELNNLSDNISKLMQDESFRQAMSEIAQELQNMQGENQGESNQGQNGQGQNSDGNGSSGNNSGQGNGQSQGDNGQGQGNGGGAGSGTDPGKENPNPIKPGSGLGSKDSSERKEGEYEKIFTPNTLGGEGEESQLKGNKGSGGNTESIITDKSNAVRGSSVPYNQVIGQYKERAFDNIESSDIPQGMQKIVRDYFSSLEE